jgi:hypothetical protein
MFSIRFDRAMSTQNIQTGETRFGQKETNVRVRPRRIFVQVGKFVQKTNKNKTAKLLNII